MLQARALVPAVENEWPFIRQSQGSPNQGTPSHRQPQSGQDQGSGHRTSVLRSPHGTSGEVVRRGYKGGAETAVQWGREWQAQSGSSQQGSQALAARGAQRCCSDGSVALGTLPYIRLGPRARG